MKLEDLPVGAAFRQPSLEVTGQLVDLSPSCATVRLDRGRDLVINGAVKARVAERTTWSRATEVEALP